jgi:hypothetical protein
MLDDSTIALVGLFVAIGGQYWVLYEMNSKIDAIRMEFGLCPYHSRAKTAASAVMGD